MNNRKLTAYVSGMCVLAVIFLMLQDWSQVGQLSGADLWGLSTLALLALVSEQQAVSIKVGGTSGGSSIGFLPLFTSVLLFGPAATVGTILATGFVVEYLIRRKEPIRANFNLAQWVISTAIGGWAFSATGGVPLLVTRTAGMEPNVLGQFGPFVLFGVVVLWINNAAVAMVMSLAQGIRYREVWRRLIGPAGTNILADLTIGPIAIAVAALYLQAGPVGLLLAILPLFFIRHSYQTTHQLQLANGDLLEALVKAIETRDPYTSGHSRRVSRLAGRIAEELKLSSRVVQEIETAGLLHDIAKIEAVYTEILRKPNSLTEEERKVIESHVTKGEKLLRNLSSVRETVIMAVRHHHEREDGAGYPDGLLGHEIPIGAKIIVVCDAVDAMLSDRPYRKALPIAVVKEQLREHAGRQFDHRVVRAFMQAEILAEYVELMRALREEVTEAKLKAEESDRPLIPVSA